MTMYFAYASNMSAAVMSAACPRHRFVGRARLPGYRLAFTRRSVRTGSGVADLLADPESVSWGVLYEIADADLSSLDAKEGAGWAYSRAEARVFTDDGTPHVAVVYLVIEKAAEEIPPSTEYAEQLLAASRARGLAEEYIAALPFIGTDAGSGRSSP